MYRTKLLKPGVDGASPHLRDRDGNTKIVVDETGELSLLPTMCGAYVDGKQTVLEKVEEENICEDCKAIAKEKGIDYSSVIAD